MAWNDVLKREDIVGGDIETYEGGDIYRGPISFIEIKDDDVIIHSPWIARLSDKDGGKWKMYRKGGKIFLSISSQVSLPFDIGQGRISFTMPFLGRSTIFPKGGSKLNLQEVQDDSFFEKILKCLRTIIRRIWSW